MAVLVFTQAVPPDASQISDSSHSTTSHPLIDRDHKDLTYPVEWFHRKTEAAEAAEAGWRDVCC